MHYARQAMKPDYWLERWRENRIGFHRADVNPRLVQHHQRATHIDMRWELDP